MKVRSQVFKELTALIPKRASYHVRKRSLSWMGKFEKQIVPSSIEDILASKNEMGAAPAYWAYWEKRLKNSKAKAVRSNKSLSVDWQYGLTIQTYDLPISLEKTPWPVIADLHTANYSLRQGKTAKGADTVHIFHHAYVREETPFQLLSPLSRMHKWRDRLIALSTWTTSRAGTSITYKIHDKGLGARYELILDHATRLPRAVIVDHSTAALFSWKKVGKKTMWLDLVIQVHRGKDIRSGEDQIRVSWTQIDRVSWNGKLPIQIQWPKPSTILDTRWSRHKTTAFDLRKLPLELHGLPWPALSPEDGEKQ